MSNRMLNYVFSSSPSNGAARLVLLVLADLADDSGLCWPLIGTILKRAQCEARTVKRALAKLEADGEVLIRRGDGRGHGSDYLIVAGRKPEALAGLIEARPPATAKRVTRCHSSAVRRVTSDPEKGDNECSKRVTSATPTPQEPLIEPPTAPASAPGSGGGSEQERIAERSAAGAVGCSGPDGAVGCSVSAAAASSQSGDAGGRAAPADPQAVEFQRALDEGRANTAKQRGALSGRPAGSGARKLLPAAPDAADPPAPARKRRIPADQQQRSFELLQRVPGLDEADAHDLARLDTFERVKTAVAALDQYGIDRVGNVGGFLRDAVTNGWRPTTRPARPGSSSATSGNGQLLAARTHGRESSRESGATPPQDENGQADEPALAGGQGGDAAAGGQGDGDRPCRRQTPRNPCRAAACATIGRGGRGSGTGKGAKRLR